MRILIADDMESWRAHVRQLLTANPELEIVGEAADGVEAVAKTYELRPDLVLLDIAMPRMNGLEAGKKILSNGSGAKVIFVSVEDAPEIVEAAIAMGAQAIVKKAEAGSRLLGLINDLWKQPSGSRN